MINESILSKKANRIIQVITEPALEPVSIEEIKLFGRIDGNTEDSLLADMIKSVRQKMELYLKRALITQTIRMSMDWWPGVNVELPRPPLQSVTSIETLAEDGTATVYSSDNYYVVTDGLFGQVVIKDGIESPTNEERFTAGFRITYVAGYGDNASNIPSSIREAIKMWVIDSYEKRIVQDIPPAEIISRLGLYRAISL